MKEYDLADMAASFLAGAIVLISILMILKETQPDIKKQAIERGHAEYVVDSDGKTTWQWKEAK